MLTSDAEHIFIDTASYQANVLRYTKMVAKVEMSWKK